jgi:hypothetical protein
MSTVVDWSGDHLSHVMEVAGACDRLGGDSSALVYTPAMTDQYLQAAGLDQDAVKQKKESEDLKPPPGSDCATWTTLAVDEQQQAVKNRRQKDCNTIANLVCTSRVSCEVANKGIVVILFFFFLNVLLGVFMITRYRCASTMCSCCQWSSMEMRPIH